MASWTERHASASGGEARNLGLSAGDELEEAALDYAIRRWCAQCEEPTMKNPLFLVVMLAGICLAGAPVAGASEDAFLGAIDSLDYYSIECPGCAQDALDVGYRVCQAFDTGGDSAAIAEVLRSYNGPNQTNPGVLRHAVRSVLGL